MLHPDPAEFFAYLTAVRGYSVHTVAGYRRQLEQAAQALAGRGQTQWAAVQPRELEQLLLDWRRGGASYATIAQRIAALRAWYQYLLDQGQVTTNPAQLVQAPKQGKRLPRNLDVDATFHLLDFPVTDGLSLRDRAMFELFYSSGIRLSELVALNVEDIQPSCELRVTGKGGKTRIVPYGRMAADWLRQWQQERRDWSGADSPALFLSQRGRRISARSVQLRLKKYGLTQGISDNVHPHKLRHSFATHMLESSGDLRAVQELLGHANLSSTQVYTHLDFRHLSQVYDAAHPRARRSGADDED